MALDCNYIHNPCRKIGEGILTYKVSFLNQYTSSHIVSCHTCDVDHGAVIFQDEDDEIIAAYKEWASIELVES